ncbi:MAG: phospholipase D family protein [Methylocella sp.]
MLKLLREHEVAPQFCRLRKFASEAVIAVPFWGKGAIRSLGLGGSQKARVICNLGAAACNPYVIADLKKLKGVSVRTHSRLHAKIYATKRFSIVGSSNASTNGLMVEGKALNGWIEANVLSDDPDLVLATMGLFDEIWRSEDTMRVTDAALLEAQTAWNNRPKQHATPTARTLLAACRENPDLFNSVFVAAYDEPLGPKGKRLLADVHRNVAPGLDASHFKNAWGYQFDETFKPGSWLVDLDCKNLDMPKVWGSSQVPVPSLRLKVKGEIDLTLTVRQPIKLNGDARQFRLSSEEKNALVAHARRILDHADGRLVPLIDAVRIIDKVRRGS